MAAAIPGNFRIDYLPSSESPLSNRNWKLLETPVTQTKQTTGTFLIETKLGYFSRLIIEKQRSGSYADRRELLRGQIQRMRLASGRYLTDALSERGKPRRAAAARRVATSGASADM